MRSPSKQAGNSPLTVREIVVFAAYAALMVAGQVAMAPLPNIEPVSVLTAACARVYGVKSLLPVFTFVLVEALIYGLGLWVINYIYIWPILALVSIALRKMEGRVLWALVLGIYGLAFGALCAVPYFFMGGVKMAFSYWASGIIFDLLHGAGNFVIGLLVLEPVTKVLKKVGG